MGALRFAVKPTELIDQASLSCLIHFHQKIFHIKIMSSVCQMLRVQHQKLQTKENNLQNEIEDLQTKLASAKDLLQETQSERKKTENLIWYYDKIALFSQIKSISSQIYSLFFGRAIEGEREDDDTVDDSLHISTAELPSNPPTIEVTCQSGKMIVPTKEFLDSCLKSISSPSIYETIDSSDAEDDETTTKFSPSGSSCFLNVRKKLEPTMSFKKEFASTSSEITLTESLKEDSDEESDGENVFLVNCLEMR